jgi:uncharacterized membrane protein
MLAPMTSRSLGRLTRNAEAPLLLESFFVAAVASFLGIRWFLAATGYPRIGSSGLHVAHMLWGGLLMLAALMLLLAFLDRSVGHVAAVVAGLGFGTFIDEIGKFVTADNDCFFRPAIALIYAVFVVAFLVARALIGRRRLTTSEALANALDLMASAPARGIEPDDRARIRELLGVADPADPRTGLATQYLAAMPGVADHDSLAEVARGRLAAGYERLMASPRANTVLVAGVVLYAALAVVGVVIAVVVPPTGGAAETATGAAVAQVSSTLVGAALIARGVVALRHSRVEAYHWFMRGLLVWILITQVFVFYSSQLGGLAGLAIDLAAYGSLRYAISRERAAGRAGHGGQPDDE